MLDDILNSVLTSVLVPGPSSNRGRLLVSLALGVVALTCEAWVFVKVGTLIRGPDWAFSLTALSVICGLVGFVIAAAHTLLEHRDRLLSYSATAVAGGAFIWPLLEL
jgi:hypothetical protein